MNDTTYTVLTHLGNILQAGDTVLGYDLAHAVFGSRQENAIEKLRSSSRSGSVPDVILVKKVFPQRDNKSKNRKNKNRIPPWRRPKSEGEGDVLDMKAVGEGLEEIENAGNKGTKKSLADKEDGGDEMLEEVVSDDLEEGDEEDDDGSYEDVDDDEEDYEDEDDGDDDQEDFMNDEDMGTWEEVPDEENDQDNN